MLPNDQGYQPNGQNHEHRDIDEGEGVLIQEFNSVLKEKPLIF